MTKPSKTIKAGARDVPDGENMLRFPNGETRYMTIHDAKLIQTFPAPYKICGTWGEVLRQIGNAVPVRLAEAMGRQLFKTLSPSTPVGKPASQHKADEDGNLLGDGKRRSCEASANRHEKSKMAHV